MKDFVYENLVKSVESVLFHTPKASSRKMVKSVNERVFPYTEKLEQPKLEASHQQTFCNSSYLRNKTFGSSLCFHQPTIWSVQRFQTTTCNRKQNENEMIYFGQVEIINKRIYAALRIPFRFPCVKKTRVSR